MATSKYALLFAFVALAIFVSGCHEPGHFGPTPPAEEMPAEEISVRILEMPSSADAGSEISITWEVSGPEQTIPHTAVHWDTTSVPGELGLGTAPADAGYTELTPEFARGEFEIPGTFTTSFTAPSEPGTVYLRAHAIVGGQNYWTSERTVEITAAEVPEVRPPPQPPQPTPPPPTSSRFSYFIEADDAGFYINGADINEITVPNSVPVEVTFKVMGPDRVYFGGLDFRSPLFGTTEKVPPNGQTTVTFTATADSEIKSYWPASNRLKDTLQVIVQ